MASMGSPPRSMWLGPLGYASRSSHALNAGLDEFTTSSIGLWPWAELARRRGMSLEAFCDFTDLRPATLRDPGTRFSQRDANRVAEFAMHEFGPNAAMEAALTIEAGHFNLLELIARSAPTVAAGLEQGCHFFPLLHSGGRLAFERCDAGGVALCWRPPSYLVHHGYVELSFAVAVTGVQRETGQDAIAAAEVCFRHETAADGAVHERVLGCPPRFGADDDHLCFDVDVARLALRRRNPDIHAVATRTAADMLEAEIGPDDGPIALSRSAQ